MSEPAGPGGPSAAIRRFLERPARARLIIGAAIVAAWYGVLYRPLRGGIDDASARLAERRRELELARQVEYFRGEVERLDGLLPEEGDTNEWVHYVMGGVRRHPLKLVALEPRPPREVGPYRAAVLRLVVEGPYRDLERFLRWLEGSRRLVRVVSFSIEPKSGGRAGRAGALHEMKLVVMGVSG